MGNIQAGGKQFVHCPFFGGRNVWAIYRQGANSLSIVGRLSTVRSVHYRRFHCIGKSYIEESEVGELSVK